MRIAVVGKIALYLIRDFQFKVVFEKVYKILRSAESVPEFHRKREKQVPFGNAAAFRGAA